jgi:hypothetical protein
VSNPVEVNTMNAEELEAVSLACKPAGDVYCLIAKKMGTCNFVGSRYLDEEMLLYLQAVGAIESQTLREFEEVSATRQIDAYCEKEDRFFIGKRKPVFLCIVLLKFRNLLELEYWVCVESK